jgi:hypothetical protein
MSGSYQAAPRNADRRQWQAMEVDDRAGLPSREARALARELGGLGSLHALVRWGLGRDPQLVVADVVVQDEFTHDVVMPYRDGLFLVFDTT